MERLVAWAADNATRRRRKVTGDRAELPWEPSEAAWAQVSTGWRECPGASLCPSGGECFAEVARHRAAKADVIVVNTHLYTTSLAVEEAELLPPHDVVVFDEAHELEDIASAALGFDLNQARLIALARSARTLVADSSATAAVEDGALGSGGAASCSYRPGASATARRGRLATPGPGPRAGQSTAGGTAQEQSFVGPGGCRWALSAP